MDPTNTLYHPTNMTTNGLSNMDPNGQTVSSMLLPNSGTANLDVLSPSSIMAQLEVGSPRDVLNTATATTPVNHNRFNTPSSSNGILGDRLLRSVLVSGPPNVDENLLLNTLSYYGDIEEISKPDDSGFVVSFTKPDMAHTLLSRHHGSPDLESFRIQPLAPPNAMGGGLQELPLLETGGGPGNMPSRYTGARGGPCTALLTKDAVHSRGGGQLGVSRGGYQQNRRSVYANDNVAGHAKSMKGMDFIGGQGPVPGPWGMAPLGMGGFHQGRAGPALMMDAYLSQHGYSSGPQHANPYSLGPPIPPVPGHSKGASNTPYYRPTGHSTSGPTPTAMFYGTSMAPPDATAMGQYYNATSVAAQPSGGVFPLALRENYPYPTRILISTNLVGAVIGRGGETIREITTSTGARVDVKREMVAWCQYTGGNVVAPHSAATNSHQKEVADRVSAGNPSPSGVGSNSATSPSSPPESQIVFICGTAAAISSAVRRIMEICIRESAAAGQVDKPHLGLLCEDRFCGRIIGREGKNLNTIREETNASVFVSNAPIVTQLTPPPHQYFTLDRIVDIKAANVEAMCQAEQLISAKLHQCQRQDSHKLHHNSSTQQHDTVHTPAAAATAFLPSRQGEMFGGASQHHGNVATAMHQHSSQRMYAAGSSQGIVGSMFSNAIEFESPATHTAPNPTSNSNGYQGHHHPHNHHHHHHHHNQTQKQHFQQQHYSRPVNASNFFVYPGNTTTGNATVSNPYHASSFVPPAYYPTPSPYMASYGFTQSPGAAVFGTYPAPPVPLSAALSSGLAATAAAAAAAAAVGGASASLNPIVVQSVLGPDVTLDDALYMRIPHISAGAVIGTEGATINKIMDDTKTMVSVSKVDLKAGAGRKDEGSGDTNEEKEKPTGKASNAHLINTLQRKVTIRGNPHNQMLAQWHIFQKVKNSSRLNSSHGGHGSPETNLMDGCGENDLCLWTILMVPRALVGRLIGKGGRTVFNIQSTTGTIVNLPKESAATDSTHTKDRSVAIEENNTQQQKDTAVGDTLSDDTQPQPPKSGAAGDHHSSAEESLYQPVEIYGTFENTQHALSRIRSLLQQVISQLYQQGQNLHHRQGGNGTTTATSSRPRHHGPGGATVGSSSRSSAPRNTSTSSVSRSKSPSVSQAVPVSEDVQNSAEVVVEVEHQSGSHDEECSPSSDDEKSLSGEGDTAVNPNLDSEAHVTVKSAPGMVSVGGESTASATDSPFLPHDPVQSTPHSA